MRFFRVVLQVSGFIFLYRNHGELESMDYPNKLLAVSRFVEFVLKRKISGAKNSVITNEKT